jgi:hypothetical protein
MTATAHALVGGAIAAHFTSNPAAAIGIALASHYIMDSVPHWDFGTNWRKRSKVQTGMIAITDTVIGFAATIAIFHSFVALPLLVATIIAAELPDWLEAPWYIFYAKTNEHGPSKRAGFLEQLSYALYKIPSVFHTKAQFPLGVLTQVVTVAFFLLLLK